MKFFNFGLVLFFACVLDYIISSKFFLSTKTLESSRSHKTALNSVGLGPDDDTKTPSATPSAVSPPTPSTTPDLSSNATGTNTDLQKTSNALGNVGSASLSISEPPYKIKSCDQVLLITGKRIVDFKDYSKKIDAFFTISVYMINLFESKDSNVLIESITFDMLADLPTSLIGAPVCIDFKGVNKRIALCLVNEEVIQQIIVALKDLYKCRMGNSLKEPSWTELKKAEMDKADLTSCSLLKKTTTPSNPLDPTLETKNNLPSLTGISDNKITNVESQETLNVPGS